MGEAFRVTEPRVAALRALNYTPAVESLRNRGRIRGSARLGDLLTSMGPAYGSVFTRHDCEPSLGVELVSQTDMFSAEPFGRVIRRDSMPRPDRHEIQRWQILVAGAGTLGETEIYGRCIIADGRLVGKYVGPHAMVLTFKDPGSALNLFTYAFLSSAAGVRAVRAASYGTKILSIRKDLLSDLPVPLPDQELLRRCAHAVEVAVQQRERYLVELRAARKIVNELPEMQEAHAMCAERKARCAIWRGHLPTLCAWNYASSGEALGLLSSHWKLRLRDVLRDGGLFKGGRFSRIPCRAPFGVELMSQGDIFSIKPIPRRVVLSARGNDAELIGVEGQLLVASRGQLTEGTLFGSIERAVHGCVGKIVTEDILRVVPRAGYEELVFAFLSTSVGRSLLLSSAFGTSIPGMRLDLVRDIPFPSLSSDALKKVVAHVRASSFARQAATTAESEAIRIMEEEVLPAWLS